MTLPEDQMIADAEYQRLRQAWTEAVGALDGDDKRDADEQRTWDALIDYVEAHDLNYTPLDPREDSA